MTRDLRAAGRALVFPTAALLAVLAFLPGRFGLALRVYALVLCVVALALAVSALRRAYPPATSIAGAPSAKGASRNAPPSLVRLEHVTALGVAGAFEFHHRLRPRLRSLALELAWSRRRLALDDDSPAARAALGDETWELVRADRPAPEDRLARGIQPAALARAVASLERL